MRENNMSKSTYIYWLAFAPGLIPFFYKNTRILQECFPEICLQRVLNFEVSQLP